jgi:TusA-related sulfurtransferase
MSDQKTHELNLVGVACPMNFVKTRLYLDKMRPGERLKVMLDAGEPVESVTTSILQEGHEIVESHQEPLGYFCLTIRKV